MAALVLDPDDVQADKASGRATAIKTGTSG